MKLVGPLMLCLPGIIALHMLTDLTIQIDPEALKKALAPDKIANPALADAVSYAQSLIAQHSETFSLTLKDADRFAPLGLVNDKVYPIMIRHVITSPVMLGLFAAVIFGSILSSFNSALNSASTLFCLEFYEGRVAPAKSEEEEAARAQHIVKVGQVFGISLAVLAVMIAPQLVRMGTIFEYLQKANGLFSVPVISIFLVLSSPKRHLQLGPSSQSCLAFWSTPYSRFGADYRFCTSDALAAWIRHQFWCRGYDAACVWSNCASVA